MLHIGSITQRVAAALSPMSLLVPTADYLLAGHSNAYATSSCPQQIVAGISATEQDLNRLAGVIDAHISCVAAPQPSSIRCRFGQRVMDAPL